MANLSKASNVVQEKYILYDVTGFTQKWHSIPVATNCISRHPLNMTAGHATLKHDHPCPLRARFHTPDYPRARKLLHPRKLFHPLPEVADDCLVVVPSRLSVAAEGD